MKNLFSHNALKTFEECPRRYKFRFIEEIELPKRVPANIYLGQVVHRTLARLYAIVQEGKTPDLEYLLKYYQSEWEKPEREQIHIDRDYMTMDDYIASGRSMIETYYAKYAPFTEAKTIGIERKLNGYLPGSSYKLRGIIDRLSRRPDGAIEICDYKTGKDLPRGGRDPIFYRQMGMYQLLVQENFPDFTKIELVQHYLKLNETITYTMSAEELDELQEELRTVIALTRRAEQLDDFPAREGGYCDFCEYQQICPAKRHRLILANEAGEVDGKEQSTAELARKLVEEYLDLYGRLKQLEAEQKALKEDLTQVAKDLNLQKLTGDSGTVTVSIKQQEKFPTKTDDPDGYAELSQLVRQLELDSCLKVDDHALRDLVIKKRLPEEKLALLTALMRIEELVSVRATPKKIDSSDGTE
ncbi:MAG: PD-(D/E)XK nuclease family protein [bacterium]|nr:PD-(D/E)XK nuclease family protein [bacterium]